MTKEEALVGLYDLIDFYYENRDLPVSPGFDFFKEVKNHCDILEVDYDQVIRDFKLNKI